MHRGGQRNRHRLVPASSGAKAPLACEDRWLAGCARASYLVAEVGKRRRSSEKRGPVGNGARGRGPGSSRIRKGSRRVKRCREPGLRWPSREAGEVRSRALERALRGKGARQTEGVSDRRWLASFTRAAQERSWRLSRVRMLRERNDTRERGDRDVRGSVRTHRDGNNKPDAVALHGASAAHRSESH